MKIGNTKYKSLRNFTRKMTEKRIHIVSLDVPFPPNYGGVIDIYNRAKALKDAGWKVILHCFEYGRDTHHPFSEIADEVIYYKRLHPISSLFSTSPYIVKSRANKTLLKRLSCDNAPVLLEGQHCTAFLKELARQDRKVLIRMHNIEWQYYAELAKRETTFLKKWFYRRESEKLRQDEFRLKKNMLLCITPSDTAYYLKNGFSAVYLPSNLPAFPAPIHTTEHYFLFHGNLSVAENEEAVLKICKEITQKKADCNILIAGKEPSKQLRQAISNAGLKLVANPDTEEMNHLIAQAKGHLLISFQTTGLKMKVLYALASGKPCLATPEILSGTDFTPFCSLWDYKHQSLPDAMGRLNALSEDARTERLDFLKEHFGSMKVVGIINCCLVE